MSPDAGIFLDVGVSAASLTTPDRYTSARPVTPTVIKVLQAVTSYLADLNGSAWIKGNHPAEADMRQRAVALQNITNAAVNEHIKMVASISLEQQKLVVAYMTVVKERDELAKANQLLTTALLHLTTAKNVDVGQRNFMTKFQGEN